MKALIASTLLLVLALPATADEPRPGRPAPLVGAIRWDAWHGDQGGPGRAVQSALGPEKWHDRLPFFAEIRGDDDVRIDGTSQEIMDREIVYASEGGLDYWAFVTYPPDNVMSLGLKRYLASTKRDRIRFCLIVESTRLRDPAYVDRLSDLMTEPGYLKVLDGRPVFYLGFITQENIDRHFGDMVAYRKVIEGLREDARRKGAGDPYLVIMDFNPDNAKGWLDALGADAISNYAAQGNAEAAPYAALTEYAEMFWNWCKGTGAQVVPILMTGWDRRPRVARPMPWETWQQPNVGIEKYYETPTPEELARHVARGLEWLEANAQHARAQLALIYAWNENDEGGWLVPTLSEGPARLDALRRVLRPGKPTTRTAP